MIGLSSWPRANEIFDTSSCLTGAFVLPNSDALPSRIAEQHVGFGVACLVEKNLIAPERVVSFGFRAVDRTPMPKASVDEHGDPRCRKQDVRFTSQRGNWPTMNPKSKASAMELGA
jgi:hypothetical protein